MVGKIEFGRTERMDRGGFIFSFVFGVCLIRLAARVLVKHACIIIMGWGEGGNGKRTDTESGRIK